MSKNLEKPKIVSDILNRSNFSPFKKLKDPLGRKEIKISFWQFPRVFIIAILIFFLFFLFSFNNSLLAPTAFSQRSVEEERQALEEELTKIEAEIDSYEKTIADLQKQKQSLTQSIKLLDAEINKLTLQIKATDIQLQKLEKEIAVLEKRVFTTEGEISRLKNLLSYYLQQISRQDDQNLLVIFLSNAKLSDFFSNFNALAILQGEIRSNLEELVDLKTNLVNQKEALAVERDDVLSLKMIKENQRKQLEQKKNEKNEILKITKGQESRYQQLLTQSKKTAAQIRSRIFSLLGGGELSFEEAYKLAKFASEQTGVRPALILAVLDRESNFGRNVGRCNWRTAMHPTRDQPPFLEITKELNINPDSVYVSCPNQDGTYGGAMGPAQFLPSTWVIYKEKIASITGNSPPSPWRNIDAFVGTALLLKDLGADKGTYQAEREAAARYYAGARWQRFLYSYGQWVVERANKYEADIKQMLG